MDAKCFLTWKRLILTITINIYSETNLRITLWSSKVNIHLICSCLELLDPTRIWWSISECQILWHLMVCVYITGPYAQNALACTVLCELLFRLSHAYTCFISKLLFTFGCYIIYHLTSIQNYPLSLVTWFLHLNNSNFIQISHWPMVWKIFYVDKHHCDLLNFIVFINMRKFVFRFLHRQFSCWCHKY